MSDSDTRKELLAAQIRIDELTADLAAARAEVERLRGIYAATRDARLDEWERLNNLPDIDEEGR